MIKTKLSPGDFVKMYTGTRWRLVHEDPVKKLY